MESSTLLFKTHLNNEAEKMPKVVVLRWGHRYRDERVTTHVALTARALGASGMILADVLDEEIKKTVEEVVESWGGAFFFKMGLPWKQVVKEWKEKKSIVVHLTAYGENVQTSDVMQRIRASRKDVLVLVGSQKVPPAFFSKAVSDFNVAIGNQPHSECSSLAVFLDHFFEGEELSKEFEGAKMKIIPQKSGKKVLKT
jgi:tRNA (cytidine56-2'-O)-methyltransferase